MATMAKADETLIVEDEINSVGEKQGMKNDEDLLPDNIVARNWAPSFRNRFPLLSSIALLIVLACAVGLVVMLYQSDGKNAETWCSTYYHYKLPRIHGYKTVEGTLTITVNVWIAIIVFVAGKAMAFTFADAVTTAWWVRAMQGRTLKELNHNWDAGKSIVGVLKNPRMFNVICLGSIAFTCFAGLGTLFQKATTTVAGLEHTSPDMSAYVATNFPAGWSGHLGAGVIVAPEPSSSLAGIQQDYNRNNEMILDVKLCENDGKTQCDLLLPAVGFRFDCKSGEMDSGYDDTFEVDAILHGNRSSIKLFDVSLYWALSNPNRTSTDVWDPWTASLDVTFKTDPTCVNSTVQYRRCKLTPAIVNYPITVVDKKVTLRLPTASPNWSTVDPPDILVDSVNRTLTYPLPEVASRSCTLEGNQTDADLEINDLVTVCEPGGPLRYENGYSGENTTVGALYSTLAAMFNMSALFNFEGSGYSYKENGVYTSNYLDSVLTDTQFVNCRSTWKDPLPDLMLQIRQFMFRTAITLAKKNATSKLDKYALIGDDYYLAASYPAYDIYDNSAASQVIKSRIIPIYKSNYTYLWIGVALMLVAVATTIPLFYGYWRLGRNVSLSPLELANAMDARNVFVTDNAVAGGSNAETKELLEYFGDRQLKYGEVAPQVLGFSFKESVRTPKNGEVYL